ncbi:NAD(P)H-dependent oxidoreductase [Sinomonas sp. JGH33]|uniref:NAD(P)H-dependent oxidoreductase n=1 Tax=Sinomonas terricola TaxID=3110330 RepID=A0ABU5TCC6_9MICC|nr:NAD(P)H-dependent oxidoreductase [Sinomonas sp. JGH33]MEA5457175.1 NAD(P)H-dependent oxidoreductase [Sinomonas sp. JGH33]
MTKIAIVTGSTRDGRKNREVAEWVLGQAQRRTDADFELIDIADYRLPLLGQHGPEQSTAGIAKFSAHIAQFDGYVFVTPEYNHSVSPALANALSYLKPELANKAAGIVSYGSAFGVRAVEHLRGILSELQIAHVQKTGMFSLFTDFRDGHFAPSELQAASILPVLDQTVAWTRALETVRAEAAVA